MTGLARWTGALAALLLFLFAGTAVRADSWALPEVTTYFSAQKASRFTVTPRALDDQLSFFSDRVVGKEPAGQTRGAATQPRGLLERRDGAGNWIRVWEGPLVNDVAPVSALVSDDGRYAVTFDNWHSVGWGDDVVVIYDSAGTPIRKLGLPDLLPISWLEALPRSVSSIWWGGKHRIEGDRLILQIVVPSENMSDPSSHVELALSLADGSTERREPTTWAGALAAAERVNAARRAAEAARVAFLTNPLLGPGSEDERDWHEYLREAFFRLDRDWKESYPGTTVLRLPGAKDYAPSRKWVREALRERTYEGKIVMFASPSQENLASVLVAEAASIKRGALKGTRAYVAVGEAWSGRIATALAHTGATYVQLDPARPIAQRPERIPGRAAE